MSRAVQTIGNATEGGQYFSQVFALWASAHPHDPSPLTLIKSECLFPSCLLGQEGYLGGSFGLPDVSPPFLPTSSPWVPP